MTIESAYTEFLQLVNRNMTNNRTNVDRPRFAMLFNVMQVKYVEWQLDKRNEDSIRNIQILLVPELPLAVSNKEDNYTTFLLPTDYLDYANAKAKASKGCCNGAYLKIIEVKSEDVEEKLTDKYNEPSFEFRETVGFTSNNKLLVYKKDFEIDEVLLTYYKYPPKIDIQGYFHDINATIPSTNIDPIFDDKVAERILIAMAKEFSARNEDGTSFQLDKERLFNI
jgi:hypothetical protein